ncbi:MAG: isoprenylcysteine carboxylmethyltransferase family protein [Deltaproteobacteria bacterium]|nr:isoprenylcysteine carboxylmethyltransferase family protein [Deltaproteobacteria bacterium]
MDFLILLTAWIWIPLIPLRLLLHAGVSFWRRLKGASVWVIAVYFFLIDLFLYKKSSLFLDWQFSPIPFSIPIGVSLVLFALLFHFWTVQTLGLSTLFLRPQMNPEKIKISIVIMGPYRWVRHPFYLVDWVMLLGLTLLTSSWLVLCIFGAALITIPFVTRFEEEELVERFGDEYRQYQKQVPRLIPRWR